MANITRSWKRFLAVGCSHGHHADQALLKKVLAFKARWKPHTTIHLGDAIDLACLRAGAAGTADDAVDPESDLQDGLAFLHQLAPQLYFLGNHEARLNTLMESPRAIVAALAGRVMGQITDQAKRMRCEVVDYNFQNGWRQLGDCLFGHGYMASENATRDHAEAVCGPGGSTKVVIAHLHRVMQAEGRNRSHPTGYCVGWLGDVNQLGYCANRRATASWSRGMGFGEFCDSETVVWLAKETKAGDFKLPI
jgi:hypothetical protein